MRSTVLFFVFFCAFVFTLNAQNTYVPDNNFEQRLIDLGYDDVLDDYVLTANISGVEYLDVQYRSISDLTGLEDFSSLRDFNCDGNSVSSIPLHPSVNLHFLACQGNQLTELDLTPHTQLFEFACTNNAITNLDFTNNTNLRYLVVGGNLFPELALSHIPELREVIAYGPNPVLEIVDVRNGNNTNIVDFVVLNAPNLRYIYVDDCNYSTQNWPDIDPTTIFVEMEGQTECEPLAVEDYFKDLAITYYPNPVKDYLNIQDSQNIKIEKIELMNELGENVKSYTPNSRKLDFRKFPSGLYFLSLKTNKGFVTTKILKE